MLGSSPKELFSAGMPIENKTLARSMESMLFKEMSIQETFLSAQGEGEMIAWYSKRLKYESLVLSSALPQS